MCVRMIQTAVSPAEKRSPQTFFKVFSVSVYLDDRRDITVQTILLLIQQLSCVNKFAKCKYLMFVQHFEAVSGCNLVCGLKIATCFIFVFFYDLQFSYVL